MVGSRRILAAFVGFLAWAPGAHAAITAIDNAETSVRLGITGGYSRYEENISPQDTETGGLLGGQVNVSGLTSSVFQSQVFPDLYTDAGYDFAAGFLKYRGNLEDPQHTPYQASDNAYYNTVVVRLGVGRPMAGGYELIPYVAGGFQNWYRNVSGAAGYGEYYRAGLIGVGLKLDYAPAPMLVLSASAEGLAVIGGAVDAPSENFSGSFGTSAEERVGLDADYRIDNTWHAYAGLGITHYAYAGSQPGGSGSFEPLSTTLQVSSMFGVAYGF